MKREIPTTVDGKYIGQGMFGSGELPMDGTECVSQKWCGLFDSEKALTIANDGIYGSHCVGDTMYLSLLRAPAYANHPIFSLDSTELRKLVHEERFVPRVDQGVHRLSFLVCGEEAEARRRKVDFEAQVLNEKPFTFEAFPGGEGTLPKKAVVLSNPNVELVAMYFDAEKGGYVLRLWNATQDAVGVDVDLPVWDLQTQVTLKPYRFVSLLVKNGTVEETTIL